MAEVDPLIGAKIDRYQVERQIGAGGMGRVYLARQPEIGARVAIKVVNAVDPDELEEWSQRLFAEARAVNLIGHENIVNVLDMVRLSDGRPALVMEYLNGVSLDRLIHESGKPLPLGMVTDVVIDVLSAIGAAHRAGILHRDLKPANVFVTPEGRAKVLDFGIAKAVSGQTFRRGLQTQAGKVLGTAVYMAPEQARGQEIDERADLFSVGLILYEAATRRRAIRGPTLGQVLEQQGSPIVPASEYRAEVTPQLDAVLVKALEPRPEDRYKSAGAMAAALRAATTPSLTRTGRSELTAALAATGRIELQPQALDPAPKPVARADKEADSESPTAPTVPYKAAAIPEPGKPASRKSRVSRAAVASGLGAAAAFAVVLLIMRADASIPLEIGSKPIEADTPPEVSPDARASSLLVARYQRGGEVVEARRLATTMLPDVELAELTIHGAFTDHGFRLDSTRLRLYSPENQANGKVPCAMIADAASGQLVAQVDTGGDCADDAPLAPPRCDAEEILAKGRLRTGEYAVDEVTAELSGKTWVFSILGNRLELPDSCGVKPKPKRKPKPEPGTSTKSPFESDLENPFR